MESQVINCAMCKKILSRDWELDNGNIPHYYRRDILSKKPYMPLSGSDMEQINSGQLLMNWFCSSKCSTQWHIDNDSSYVIVSTAQ